GIPASNANLLVSEIMYNPANGNEAEAGKGFFFGDYFEFIELVNVGDKDMYIGDCHFAGGISFPFSESAIQALKPGERVVLVSDLEAFALRYGDERPIGGEFVGRLANGGERLTLMRGDEVIQEFRYNDRDPWPETPDGDHGLSLVLSSPAPGVDLSNPSNWAADSAVGGSPGEAGTQAPVVLVNEVLANSGPDASDAVELYNPSGEAIDIGGWFLTDDADTPAKYTFPEGTSVPAGGYLVVEQDNDNDPANEVVGAEFFGAAFGLNSTGDSLYLFSADAVGNLTGHQDGFSFGDAEEGSSFGRLEKSTGEADYPIQSAATLGAANAGPLQSRVVITEIMYNPAEGGSEFVEIHNQTGETVELSHPDMATATWRISGLGFRFPAGASLAGGETALVVTVDPEAFRTQNGVAGDVQIFGPAEGRLANGGENLQLQRPIILAGDDVRYVTTDEIRYDDEDPWTADADGTGQSLARSAPADYGNDAANWAGADPTPGSLTASPEPEINAEIQAWLTTVFDASQLANPAISGLSADPDQDGLLNLVEYALNTSPTTADGSPFTLGEMAVDGASYLTLTFNTRDNLGAEISLESSEDLQAWSAVSNSETTTVENGLMIRDGVPLGSSDERYVRIRVQAK
ncbi:MAG: lamin tail domain-containing protein, partial [Verrucomicrobiota bacterium]